MISFTTLCALLGGGLAIGLGAIGSAIGEGYIAMKAVESLGRQPNSSGKLLRTMLIGQAVTETAAIFALVVSLMLIFQAHEPGVMKGISLLAAGLAIGIGSIGSGFGSGLPGGGACEGIGKQPENNDILSLHMLIGQAVTQTGTIYALSIALVLIITDFTATLPTMFALIAAALTIGFGTIGPGVGEGIVAIDANRAVAKGPNHMGLLTRTMLVGQAVTETTAIYSVVVALILLFVI